MSRLFLTTVILLSFSSPQVFADDQKELISHVAVAKSEVPEYDVLDKTRLQTKQQATVSKVEPVSTHPEIILQEPIVMTSPTEVKIERYATENTDTGVDMDAIQHLLE
jgi:hypothetical protein